MFKVANASQTSKLLGTIGIISGMGYAIKHDKGTKGILIYGALFGIGGFLLGNALSKFYES
jgi:hypothetical protein